MNRLAIVKEFLDFLRERKKWWIAPIVVFLLLLGGLLIFAIGSALVGLPERFLNSVRNKEPLFPQQRVTTAARQEPGPLVMDFR